MGELVSILRGAPLEQTRALLGRQHSKWILEIAPAAISYPTDISQDKADLRVAMRETSPPLLVDVMPNCLHEGLVKLILRHIGRTDRNVKFNMTATTHHGTSITFTTVE